MLMQANFDQYFNWTTNLELRFLTIGRLQMPDCFTRSIFRECSVTAVFCYGLGVEMRLLRLTEIGNLPHLGLNSGGGPFCESSFGFLQGTKSSDEVQLFSLRVLLRNSNRSPLRGSGQLGSGVW